MYIMAWIPSRIPSRLVDHITKTMDVSQSNEVDNADSRSTDEWEQGLKCILLLRNKHPVYNHNLEGLLDGLRYRCNITRTELHDSIRELVRDGLYSAVIVDAHYLTESRCRAAIEDLVTYARQGGTVIIACNPKYCHDGRNDCIFEDLPWTLEAHDCASITGRTESDLWPRNEGIVMLNGRKLPDHCHSYFTDDTVTLITAEHGHLLYKRASPYEGDEIGDTYEQWRMKTATERSGPFIWSNYGAGHVGWFGSNNADEYHVEILAAMCGL